MGGKELNVNLRNDSIPDDTVLWATTKKKRKKRKKIYIYRDRKCMILMLKGNLNSTKNYEIKSFGLVYYRKDKNTRSLFESLLIWGDIVARRNSITCAILSIPTESRFTNALERSPRTFTSSIITATVAGNFGIFFDV